METVMTTNIASTAKSIINSTFNEVKTNAAKHGRLHKGHVKINLADLQHINFETGEQEHSRFTGHKSYMNLLTSKAKKEADFLAVERQRELQKKELEQKQREMEIAWKNHAYAG
jgi:hypothetical protein